MADSDLDVRTEKRLQMRFAISCLECCQIGVQIFMCIYGLNVFLETQGGHRRRRGILVTLSFIILALNILGDIPYLYYNFWCLFRYTSGAETFHLQLQLLSSWWVKANNWILFISWWVGDGLLVYRCWAVWRDKPIFPMVSALVYAGTVVTSIMYAALDLRKQPFSSAIKTSIYTAMIACTISVNTLVTLLISGRLLHMRKRQAKLLLIDSKMYIGIVAVLVESAAPLSIFGVLFMITLERKIDHYGMMRLISEWLWTASMALSPQMIIFRVTMGRSWVNSTEAATHLSSLAFQHQTQRTSGELESNIVQPFPDHEVPEKGVAFAYPLAALDAHTTEK